MTHSAEAMIQSCSTCFYKELKHDQHRGLAYPCDQCNKFDEWKTDTYTDENEPSEAKKYHDGLPEMCFGTLPMDKSTIIIKRGEIGYWKSHYAPNMADELNKVLGVTDAQAKAMQMGSQFGWLVPAANPAEYDENGILKGNEKSLNREE